MFSAQKSHDIYLNNEIIYLFKLFIIIQLTKKGR